MQTLAFSRAHTDCLMSNTRGPCSGISFIILTAPVGDLESSLTTQRRCSVIKINDYNGLSGTVRASPRDNFTGTGQANRANAGRNTQRVKVIQKWVITAFQSKCSHKPKSALGPSSGATHCLFSAQRSCGCRTRSTHKPIIALHM